MRKFAFIFVAAFVFAVSALSQNTKTVDVSEKTSGQPTGKKVWQEMEDFHTVMSQTYHPATEGKFEPIKTRIQEMVDKAVAWQKSSAPKGYDKKRVEASLKKLVKGVKELNVLLKAKSNDKVIKDKLSGLHDIFHEIMEKCEDEEHHN